MTESHNKLQDDKCTSPEGREPGWPMPVSERPEPLSVKRCARCNEDEFRIDGFCSVECRDYDEYEREIASLTEKVERLPSLHLEILALKAELLPSNDKRIQAIAGELQRFADTILGE